MAESGYNSSGYGGGLFGLQRRVGESPLTASLRPGYAGMNPAGAVAGQGGWVNPPTDSLPQFQGGVQSGLSQFPAAMTQFRGDLQNQFNQTRGNLQNNYFNKYLSAGSPFRNFQFNNPFSMLQQRGLQDLLTNWQNRVRSGF